MTGKINSSDFIRWIQMGCESVGTACDINQIFVPDIAQINIGSKHFVTELKVFEMKWIIDVLLRFKANNFAIIEVDLHKNDLRKELKFISFLRFAPNWKMQNKQIKRDKWIPGAYTCTYLKPQNCLILSRRQ